MTAKRRTTTTTRARKETVASEEATTGEDQAVAEPKADVVEEPTPPVDTESGVPPEDVLTPPEAAVEDKGFCDNHPAVAAVVVTNFPWSLPQRFCQKCVPNQYRHLL